MRTMHVHNNENWAITTSYSEKHDDWTLIYEREHRGHHRRRIDYATMGSLSELYEWAKAYHVPEPVIAEAATKRAGGEG